MGDILFTVHAQRTMAARKVTFDEIREVVTKPEVVYGRRPDRPGTEVRQRGELGIVVRPYPATSTVLVITILWRHTDHWTDDEMRTRS